MTRSVEDACLMMNVHLQPGTRDWHSLPYDGTDYTAQLGKGIKGLKIAFSPTLGTWTSTRKSPGWCGRPWTCCRTSAPGSRKSTPASRTLPPASAPCGGPARSLLGRLPPAKRKLLDPTLAEVIEQAKSITLDDYQEAVRIRGLLGSRMRQF